MYRAISVSSRLHIVQGFSHEFDTICLHGTPVNSNKSITNNGKKRKKKSYRFTADSGAQADFDASAMPLSCSQTLFSYVVILNLVGSINSYAEIMCKMNHPAPSSRSVYYNWKPVAKSELLEFIAMDALLTISIPNHAL